MRLEGQETGEVSRTAWEGRLRGKDGRGVQRPWLGCERLVADGRSVRGTRFSRGLGEGGFSRKAKLEGRT